MAVTASSKSAKNQLNKGVKMVDHPNELLRDKHIKYFKHMLTLLPEAFEGHDSIRLTILFFSLGGKFLLH